ncbi:MAG: c-type cytochrome [Cyanobacterium sp.]
MVIILSFWLLPSKNPYIVEVLSYQGNAERGEAIFNVNCAGCHGVQGVGNVGPTLTHVSRRKSEESIINQVISGQTPPMPKFQPSAEEMADLLVYLRELN